MAKRSGFAASAFNRRTSSAVAQHYVDHEVVFSQGDSANSIFCVQQGHVKLTMASMRKRQAVIAILSAGDCFGEGCLNGNPLRAYTAISVNRSTVDEVSKRALTKRLRAEPALTQHLTSYLLGRIDRAQDDIAAFLVESSERRLARLLIQVSGFGTTSEHTVPMVDIDQGTLAQLVGTTRSRVSFFMNRFRKHGFIDYNGSLQVKRALLTFLAEP